MDRFDVLDWRRRTSALYARVRERAVDDPAAAHTMWCDGRAAMLRDHPASPVPASARGRWPGPNVAPYDPEYRFVVPVRPSEHVEQRDVMTGTDGVVRYEVLGTVALPGLGSLEVTWCAVYGGGLHVAVRDATSGRTTYGGGRYVLDTVKGADLGGDRDALVVDLNFAYQPSCAYDEAWACPLPSAGSRLAVEVPVGERFVPVS